MQVLPDVFLFEHPKVVKRSASGSVEHHGNLENDLNVSVHNNTL